MATRMQLWACVVMLVVCMAVAAQGLKIKHGTLSRLANFGRKHPGFVRKYSDNYMCDACLQLSQEAQVVLSNPDTLEEAIMMADQYVCGPLQPGLQKKCEKMVQSYVPEVLLELEARLGPDKLCFESGLCTSPALLAFDNDKKSCMVCQDLATDALTYLENNKTRAEIVIALHLACSRLQELSKQCDLLVDIYTPHMMEQLENLTPQEFCQMTKMCKSPKLSLHRNDCVTCQFVVLEIKLKLKDPKTQEKVLQVLLNGCNKVNNHVDECKAIVEEYGPFILANLDTLLDSDAVCCKIGLCQSKLCPDSKRAWAGAVAKLHPQLPPAHLELPQARHGTDQVSTA